LRGRSYLMAEGKGLNLSHGMTHRSARLVAAAAAALVCWGPARGPVLWFDETGGGSGYSTFGDLAQAHSTFLGTPGQTVNFNGLAEGTILSNHYDGVTFGNTAGGPYASSSGVRSEGGAIAEHLTGYDGTYMPNGDKVYVKFSNNTELTPFTINFATPVSVAGAFVGMGMEGGVHTLTISAYDAAGDLLGARTVHSWLWESGTYLQNYESFFALRAGEEPISKLTIRNDSMTNFSNALVLDNLSFSSADAAVPEPRAFLLVAAGGVAAMCARPRQGRLATARC